MIFAIHFLNSGYVLKKTALSPQIEALEEKIKTEMTTLKEKMRTMEDEMEIFSDLDKLRNDSETKRQLLEVQSEELTNRRTAVAENLEDMVAQTEEIKVSYHWLSSHTFVNAKRNPINPLLIVSRTTIGPF